MGTSVAKEFAFCAKIMAMWYQMWILDPDS